MTIELIKAAVASFLGTLGFCVLLQVPRRAVLPASVLGMLSYLVYLAFLALGIEDTPSIFIGAAFGALAAQLLARRMRMVSTIFVLLSIVPSVPGLGVYRFMEQLATGKYTDGGKAGVDTMVTVLAITLGIAAGSMIAGGLRRLSGLRERRRTRGSV